MKSIVRSRSTSKCHSGRRGRLAGWSSSEVLPCSLPLGWRSHAQVGLLHLRVAQQFGRHGHGARCARSPSRSRGRRSPARHARSGRPAGSSCPRALSAAMRREDLGHQAAAPGPCSARRAAAAVGRAISARPIASICCWPPESVPASSARFSAQRRETSRTHAFESFARAARERAEQQVVLDRHRREHLAPLGHLHDAAAARAGAPGAGRCPAPSKRIVPPLRRLHARQRAQQRRLARAVGADQRHQFAGPRPAARPRPAPGCGRSGCPGPAPQAWAAPALPARRRRDRPRSRAGRGPSRRRALGQLACRGRARARGPTRPSPAACCARPAPPSCRRRASRLISASISCASVWLSPAAGSSSSSTLRLGRQRARDLQALERAIGHRVGRRVFVGGQAHRAQQARAAVAA